MKVDLYTRVVLTVIAACLVWLCIDRQLTAPVAAQSGYERMIIAGWLDEKGGEHKLEFYGGAAIPVNPR
jgi:hypothetical protein